jgi:hypothetical protein
MLFAIGTAGARMGRNETSITDRHFDMLTILRVPTCVNHATVQSALRYLTPKGLRRLWVVTPAKWVARVARIWPHVWVVGEDQAAAGVDRAVVEHLLNSSGFNMQANSSRVVAGRSTPGWYLVQAINLAFVLRDDVLDTLLVHDADMVVLPSYEVHAPGVFVFEGVKRPRIAVKVGGLVSVEQYSFAHHCLTGDRMLYHGLSNKQLRSPYSASIRHRQTGSFVTHSYTVFRPFVRKMLDRFEASLSRHHIAAATRPSPAARVLWLQAVIGCLNQERPDYGFGESGSYISWVLAHHSKAHLVSRAKSWARNLKKSQVNRSTSCCPQPFLEGHGDLEFLGVELGHSASDNGGCKVEYSAGYVDAEAPYPPAHHPFWLAQGVNVSNLQ